MKINPIKGHIAKDISENFGYNKLTVLSSGLNNNTTSLVYVNNDVVYRNNQRGLTVITFNENLSIETARGFDVYNGGASHSRPDLAETQARNFSNYINSILSSSEEKLFVITSWDAILYGVHPYKDIARHDTANAITISTMGKLKSQRFKDIEYDYWAAEQDGTEYGTRTPYSAIGTTKKGIMYESMGSCLKGAKYPHALVSAILPELENIGMQGYSKNLIVPNNQTIRTSDYINIGNPEISQYVKLDFLYKFIDYQNGNINVATIYLETIANNKVESSVNLGQFKSSLDQKFTYYFFNDINKSYRLRVNKNNNQRINFYSLNAHPCNVNDIEDIAARYSNNDIMSTKSFKDTYSGVDPYYGTNVNTMFEENISIFDESLIVSLYNNDVTKGIFVNNRKESDTLQINQDESYQFICYVYSNLDYSPKIELQQFSGDTLIKTDTLVSYENISRNETVLIESFLFNNVNTDTINDVSNIQNKHYGSIEDDHGYSKIPSVNNTIKLENNTTHIIMALTKNTNNNYYCIYPFIKYISPTITKDKTVYPYNLSG